MGGEGSPVPIQVVELKSLQDLLRQQANKTTLEIEYTNGEPRITLIFTDRSVDETIHLIAATEYLTRSLVTQAYEHMGVWKKDAPVEGKPCRDMNVA